MLDDIVFGLYGAHLDQAKLKNIVLTNVLIDSSSGKLISANFVPGVDYVIDSAELHGAWIHFCACMHEESPLFGQPLQPSFNNYYLT